MAEFKVVTIFDQQTGLLAAEVYSPDTAVVPLVKTQPIYRTHNDAVQHVINTLKKMLPAQQAE